MMMGGMTPTGGPGGQLFPPSPAMGGGGGFGGRAPASFGRLRVTVAGCKGLPSALANVSGRTYVRIKLGDQEKKGAPAREGGARPRFGDDYDFDVRMDREMEMAIVLPSGDGQPDNVMGTVRTNIMPWIAQGTFSGDLDMKDPMFQPVGQITISVSFQRSTVPSLSTARGSTAIAAGMAPVPSAAAASGGNTLFTDEEIRDAFVQFDLDKNNFVGPAEVRHILINIGESVTDEEVDEMIRMVDRDGDGQVAFPEFYRMVTGGREPPAGLYQGSGSVPYQGPGGGASAAAAAASPLPTQAKKGAYIEGPALEGPAALAAKAAKKKALEDMVRAFGINVDGVRRAYNDFDASDKTGSGSADYATFCDVFRLEPGPVSEDAFARYDGARCGRIDYREFCVALLQFTPAKREEKIKFAFHVYDDNADGVLTKEELIKVLRANHLASSEKEVARKGDTMLAQAEHDDCITVADFEKVAKKFPNICFQSNKA